MAVWIALLGHGGKVRGHTLVDAEDADLALLRWHLSGKGYAARRENGRGYFLHRQLLGLEYGDPLQADHINGDRLDNRRANLRVVSAAENHQNIAAHAAGTSRYRGVTWRPRRRKWEARGWEADHNVYLGSFDSEQAAALVVAEWRMAHMPFTNEERH